MAVYHRTDIWIYFILSIDGLHHWTWNRTSPSFPLLLFTWNRTWNRPQYALRNPHVLPYHTEPCLCRICNLRTPIHSCYCYQSNCSSHLRNPDPKTLLPIFTINILLIRKLLPHILLQKHSHNLALRKDLPPQLGPRQFLFFLPFLQVHELFLLY